MDELIFIENDENLKSTVSAGVISGKLSIKEVISTINDSFSDISDRPYVNFNRNDALLKILVEILPYEDGFSRFSQI